MPGNNRLYSMWLLHFKYIILFSTRLSGDSPMGTVQMKDSHSIGEMYIFINILIFQI